MLQTAFNSGACALESVSGADCPRAPVSRLAHARGRILFVAVAGGILVAPRAPFGVFFIVLLWPLATLAG